MADKPVQTSLDLEFRPAYGCEDFLISDSNRDAVLTLDGWPSLKKFPFLIVYGDEGSGKRHLAAVWQAMSGAQIIEAEDFKDINSEELFKEQPNLIIHGLDRLLGDRLSEENLFHLYNVYDRREKNSRVLFTSRKSPELMEFLVPDLRSRINIALQAPIKPPDDDLRMRVLAKQLHDMGFKPSEDVLIYALNQMNRSWPDLKKLSDVLNRLSLETHKPLSKALVKEALLRLEP